MLLDLLEDGTKHKVTVRAEQALYTVTLGGGSGVQRRGVLADAQVPFSPQGKGTDNGGYLAWLFYLYLG